MNATLRPAFLALALLAGSGSFAFAAPLDIRVLTVHRGAPIESSVTAIDKGESPVRHYTGLTNKAGVYLYRVYPDDEGQICFSAVARYNANLRAPQYCIKPPYPAVVQLELK